MSTVDLATALVRTRPGSIPEEARHTARLAVMDCLGVALAATNEPATCLAREVALAQGGRSSATLWGTTSRTSCLDAALVNGVASHVLDLDDTNRSTRGHPTVTLVPALLALAEERRLPGRALLDAYVLGFEVECRLGRLMNLAHYERGWHTTPTLGTVGAAAAAGWLLGLEAEPLTHALGIAASLAGGLRRNFGSMAKSLHVGNACRSGLLAALLAERGFTANPEVLESPDGFVEIFSGRRGDRLARSVEQFGRPWDLLDAGIDFKLYPCCNLAHAAIDAALELRERHGIRAEEIEAVESCGSYRCAMVLSYHEPEDELQAKFSMEYAVAVALLDGRAGIDQFANERVRREDVQDLLRRVRFQIHPDLETEESLAHDFSIVRVRLSDGRGVVEQRVGRPRATPENPVPDQVLEEKFRDCALRALPEDQVEAVLVALRQMEALEDLEPLVRNLRP